MLFRTASLRLPHDPRTTPGLSHMAIPRRLDRGPLDFARGRLRAEWRDLLSTISGLSLRESLSAPRFALRSRRRNPSHAIALASFGSMSEPEAIWAIAGRNRSSRRRPWSVSATLRVVRCSRRTPRRSSSCRIAWLSAEGVMPTRDAAARKLSSSATATNAVRSARSPRCIHKSISTQNAYRRDLRRHRLPIGVGAMLVHQCSGSRCTLRSNSERANNRRQRTAFTGS